MPEITADVATTPVVRRVVVHTDAAHAFRAFTDEIASWWPADDGHSLGGDRVADIALEGRMGGLLVERWQDGTRHPWAEVLAWDPPSRVVLAWHPGRDRSAATEVEVTFTEERAGLTRVVLTHRGWERLGPDAVELRASYDAGWLPVLNRFKGRADDASAMP